MAHWTDSIVGNRMAVDREFNEQVTNSRLDSQEWRLITTMTEFGIENADDPETARIVADAEKVPQVIPELNNICSRTGAMGDGGNDSSSGDGTVDSIKGALGVGGGDKEGGQEKLGAAERPTQERADAFQDHLEKKGKWSQVRVSYFE